MNNTYRHTATSNDKFKLGNIHFSGAAATLLSEKTKALVIKSHVEGDWDDINRFQKASNESSIKAKSGHIISKFLFEGEGEYAHIFTDLDTGNTCINLFTYAGLLVND